MAGFTDFLGKAIDGLGGKWGDLGGGIVGGIGDGLGAASAITSLTGNKKTSSGLQLGAGLTNALGSLQSGASAAKDFKKDENGNKHIGGGILGSISAVGDATSGIADMVGGGLGLAGKEDGQKMASGIGGAASAVSGVAGIGKNIADLLYARKENDSKKIETKDWIKAGIGGLGNLSKIAGGIGGMMSGFGKKDGAVEKIGDITSASAGILSMFTDVGGGIAGLFGD